MEIQKDIHRLKEPLQSQRNIFLLTVYGCRLAVAHTFETMKFPPNAFGEIKSAANVLEAAGKQIKNKGRIPSESSLIRNLCYQTTISAIAELQGKSEERDELKFTQWSNFNNLEPRDKYPLELYAEIEKYPTFWQITGDQEWDRIDQLTKTARKLQNNIIPSLPDLLQLGHFSCAAVIATDRLIDQIS